MAVYLSSRVIFMSVYWCSQRYTGRRKRIGKTTPKVDVPIILENEKYVIECVEPNHLILIKHPVIT